MNNIIYYCLNRLKNIEPLNKEYTEDLYNYYKRGSEIFHYQSNITKEEFQYIIEYIYNVLILRINEYDFHIICEHYIKLLIADVRDGEVVNTSWFIDHLWYLCMGLSDTVDVKKYNDCILFIQKNLIKQLNISETLNEKIKRRVYTGFMIR